MNTLNLEETLKFKQLFDDRVTVQTQIQKKTLEFEAQTKELREQLVEIDKQLAKLGLRLDGSQEAEPGQRLKRGKSKALIEEALMESGKKGYSVPEIAEKTGIKAPNVSAWLFFNVSSAKNPKKHPNIKKDGPRYYWSEGKKSK